MATSTDTSSTRKRAPRKTQEEKAKEAAARADGYVAQAMTILVNGADGYMRRGDRVRARECLDAWTNLSEILRSDEDRRGEYNPQA